MHWRGGIPPALELFQCIVAVLCVAFFVCLVPNFIVCLVSSFRYNGLATLALAGPSGPRAGPSGPLQALRARRAGPSGPHWGGDMPLHLDVLRSTSIGSKELSA